MSEHVAQTGGCHCGAVRFEVHAPLLMDVLECNCSMCAMSGFWHLIVPARDFVLLQGAAALRRYQFNSGTAQHLFCGHCGIKSYYIPRSNPDGFDINVRCLDPHPQRVIRISPYDGRNWEAGAAALRELSAP
jgi:hypothetical protein